MNIIPAIDVLDRKVVRLFRGDYDKATIYNITLEEAINQFESQGTDFVHVVDLNGAKGDYSNQKFVVDALKKSKLKVQYGGGIRSLDKVKEFLDFGFHRIVIGTQAHTDANFLENVSKEVTTGPEKMQDHIVIALDVLDEVIKYGGRMETSPLKLMDYIDKCTSLGFFRFLCTDIAKDGILGGSNVALYQKLMEHKPFIKLIAAGGISSMDDIDELLQTKVESVIVGKAFYEGRVSTEDIKSWNLQALVSF